MGEVIKIDFSQEKDNNLRHWKLSSSKDLLSIKNAKHHYETARDNYYTHEDLEATQVHCEECSRHINRLIGDGVEFKDRNKIYVSNLVLLSNVYLNQGFYELSIFCYVDIIKFAEKNCVEYELSLLYHYWGKTYDLAGYAKLAKARYRKSRQLKRKENRINLLTKIKNIKLCKTNK